MTREEITAAITDALGTVLEREVPEATEETRLFDELHLDSTSVLELLMALEDATGIEVDPEDIDMDDFATVGTLASYLESRGPARSAAEHA
ncbi:acyl carrier protein [Nocardiopsis potens]|uniref:acyl carrier protein n=1 Tax=Nocardiopsis potens TaxID=1246458 RepID=UPI0003452B23|nr:acyl carrier protein [Nocardiopsis potens]